MSIFLKNITSKEFPQKGVYPFSIPAYRTGIDIKVTSPFLIFTGENACGKSTLLEAIADGCGFNIRGGNHNHTYGDQAASELSSFLTLGWMPRIHKGFYLRAENLAYFSDYIDDLAVNDPSIHEGYGGKSLKEKSHGEGFLSLFSGQLQKGIFLLDEPETALSPKKQIEFIALIQALAEGGNAQFIIATHSPMIMSIPNAQLLDFSPKGIQETSYQETEHYQLTKLFLDSPERFHSQLMKD